MCKKPYPCISRSSSDTTASSAFTVPVNCDETKAPLGEHSAYSVSTSRFLRVSTTPSIGTGAAGNAEAISLRLDDAESLGAAQSQDDFLLVQPSDLDDKIYLFTRTCREKETWFRRLYGASIGKPMLLTTQQAGALLFLWLLRIYFLYYLRLTWLDLPLIYHCVCYIRYAFIVHTVLLVNSIAYKDTLQIFTKMQFIASFEVPLIIKSPHPSLWCFFLF